MFFKQIVHEDLGYASYLVCSTESSECVVIDPRWEIEPYLDLAAKHGFRISHIVETHNHADHVSGHGRLVKATGAEIHVHEGAGVGYRHHPLKDGDIISLGDVRLHVLHTPGHRPEHIALAVEDTSRGNGPWMVLTGDSLFVGDVARPDLAVDGQEGAKALYHSLHHKLLQLPEYTEVYPAHVSGSLCGRVTSSVNSTTLGYEKRFNGALRLEDEREFVSYMNQNLPVRPPNMEKIVEQNRGPLITENPPLEAVTPSAVQDAVREGAVLLDVRPSDAYLQEHIPGSVHVSLSALQFGTRVGFVLSPETRLILVAENAEKAQRAADSLRLVAFDALVGYVDMETWKTAGKETVSTAGIAPRDLHHRLQCGDDLRVLDVREPSEWETGHIAGATFIPYRELPARMEEIPAGLPLAVTCGSSSRSPVAVSLLERAGFANLINVDKGMSGWNAVGLPTSRDARFAGLHQKA